MSTPEHILNQWHHGTPQEDVVRVRNTGRNPVSSCILNAPDIRSGATGYVVRGVADRFPALVLVGESAPEPAAPAPAIPAAPAPAAPVVIVDETVTSFDDPTAFDSGQYSAKEARGMIAASTFEDLTKWVNDPRPSVRKAVQERVHELEG